MVEAARPAIRRKRLFLFAVMALILGLLPLMQPAPSSGAEQHDEALGHGGHDHTLEFQELYYTNFDNRSGDVEPTAQQLNMVGALGAQARWNRFGSPRSLIKYGDYLAVGLTGEPASAVREWIRANRALFRLSDADVTNLELLLDYQLRDSQARTLVFRQRFGDYSAAHDGLINISYVDGKIVYVSASTAGWNGNQLGTAALSPEQAWQIAAGNIGRSVQISEISRLGLEQDWTMLKVAGFSQDQQIRLRALPQPSGEARLVYETNVVNVQGGESLAVTIYVDALSGEVLLRQNRKEYFADAPVASGQTARFAPINESFSGEYVEGACGPRHPFEVPAGYANIFVTASANLLANDIVLKLYYNDGTMAEDLLVATQDTGTSPEAIAYAPVGGLPAGTYKAEVCPFSTPLVSGEYTGTFTASEDASAVGGYPPKWSFFRQNPPLDHSTTDTRVLGCWVTEVEGQPVEGCDTQLRTIDHPAWDISVSAGQPTYTTIGNNAETAESWFSPLTPSTQRRPVSATRDYQYPWTNQWYETGCSQASFTSPEMNDIDAAITNLFVAHNRMHDWSFLLGFTEETWNLQRSNLSADPAVADANDPEVGNAQAGAVDGGAPSYTGRDNANQITLQDGTPGITNMYLWQPIAAAFYAPCVDGDYDMSVIAHEYTHAISNRMVGGPDSNLSDDQSRAMGESWSDLAAIEYLNAYGLVPVADESPFAVGPYVTGNGQRGIRNYNMSNSPLNYSNIGYDQCNADLVTGNCTNLTQVHADGEIWSATNFAIRRDLIAKYNSQFPAGDLALQRSCADGETPVNFCPGNRRWIQIMFDAFLLMQADVSMLDARDAYLAADMARFGGANQAEMWTIFARRGMGQHALSDGGDDADPIPDFSAPGQPNATVTFSAVAVDEQRRPIDAAIYVGRYEARVTPIADTMPKTPISMPTVTGSYTMTRPMSAQFAPITYQFIAQAPGYGMQRFTRTFKPGEQATVVVEMRTNRASTHNGALAFGDAASGTHHNLQSLIDDTEATNWAKLGTSSVSDSRVTVKMPGGYIVDTVNVSAMFRPKNHQDAGGDTGSQNRFTTLRQFEILACFETVQIDCEDANGEPIQDSFTVIYTSAPDAFPARAPRPVVEDLRLRAFQVPPTPATHVQLHVLANQCTGGPEFQGDQDNDPSNNSDCQSSAQAGNVRAAELQVFGDPAYVRYLPKVNR